MESSSLSNDKRKVFVMTKLKELEINKGNLFDQLIKINNEFKGLQDRGLANVYTMDIIRKEVGSLEAKLVEQHSNGILPRRIA